MERMWSMQCNVLPAITRGILRSVRTSLTQAMTRDTTSQSTEDRCMSCTGSRRFHPPSLWSGQQCPLRLAFKCALSHGPPVLDYTFEPQSVVGMSNCKPQCDRSAITDQTVHNNRRQTVSLDKTIKAAYSADVAISNGHNLHSTVTKMLHICTEFKEQLIIIIIIIIIIIMTSFISPKLRNSSSIQAKNTATASGLCNTTSNIHNGYYPKQITQKLKLLTLGPCSVCSNAESSNT